MSIYGGSLGLEDQEDDDRRRKLGTAVGGDGGAADVASKRLPAAAANTSIEPRESDHLPPCDGHRSNSNTGQQRFGKHGHQPAPYGSSTSVALDANQQLPNWSFDGSRTRMVASRGQMKQAGLSEWGGGGVVGGVDLAGGMATSTPPRSRCGGRERANNASHHGPSGLMIRLHPPSQDGANMTSSNTNSHNSLDGPSLGIVLPHSLSRFPPPTDVPLKARQQQQHPTPSRSCVASGSGSVAVVHPASSQYCAAEASSRLGGLGGMAAAGTRERASAFHGRVPRRAKGLELMGEVNVTDHTTVEEGTLSEQIDCPPAKRSSTRKATNTKYKMQTLPNLPKEQQAELGTTSSFMSHKEKHAASSGSTNSLHVNSKRTSKRTRGLLQSWN